VTFASVTAAFVSISWFCLNESHKGRFSHFLFIACYEVISCLYYCWEVCRLHLTVHLGHIQCFINDLCLYISSSAFSTTTKKSILPLSSVGFIFLSYRIKWQYLWCLILLWSPPVPKTHTLPLKNKHWSTKKESCKQVDRQTRSLFRTCTVLFYYKICWILQSCILDITERSKKIETQPLVLVTSFFC